MPGLATFYAYTNRSVKAVFEDRTIVRMIEGCDSIRILNRRAEEITLNSGKTDLTEKLSINGRWYAPS